MDGSLTPQMTYYDLLIKNGFSYEFWVIILSSAGFFSWVCI